MKKRIAYIISHGHTARGALQTGLLSALSKNAEVHVIAKKDAIKALEEPVKGEGAFIHPFELKLSRSDAQRSMLRSHIHQNIRNNPALWEKHLWRTRSKKNSWKKRMANHLYYYLGAIARLLPFFSTAFARYEAKAYFKESAAKLLKDIEADMIISTRPVDEMEICLLEAAKRLNIHRCIYILSWDNITSKGIFAVLGDSYLTWGPVMNEELKEYYQVKDENIYNTGVTHFDIHAKVRNGELKAEGLLSNMGLKDDLPYILFTMSASYYAPNEIDIVEYLAAEIEKNTFGEKMQFVIRPHMANLMADRSDQSWLKRLEALKSNRVALDIPDSDNSLLTWYMQHDDMIKLSTLINNAQICLNSGSTISIEAAYLNRPIILTAFDTEDFPKWQSARRLMEYIHLAKFASYGAARMVNSLEEMKESIFKYLEDPEYLNLERKKVVEEECYKNDGRATERFVENVSHLLQNKI